MNQQYYFLLAITASGVMFLILGTFLSSIIRQYKARQELHEKVLVLKRKICAMTIDQVDNIKTEITDLLQSYVVRLGKGELDFYIDFLCTVLQSQLSILRATERLEQVIKKLD